MRVQLSRTTVFGVSILGSQVLGNRVKLRIHGSCSGV